ncbi:MAG TPA: hypothetical protein VGD54_19740 [Steroidobacteraceae bacterium]
MVPESMRQLGLEELLDPHIVRRPKRRRRGVENPKGVAQVLTGNGAIDVFALYRREMAVERCEPVRGQKRDGTSAAQLSKSLICPSENFQS